MWMNNHINVSGITYGFETSHLIKQKNQSNTQQKNTKT